MGVDIFLSHLQRNGQDAIIAMQLYLKQAKPGIRTFIDLEVDMQGDLSKTLHDAVQNCSAFLFFITDGILDSKWCAQEIRWAVQFQKNIILVRETDERHGGISMKDFFKQVPQDLMETFQNIIAIPWYREPAYRDVSIKSILKAAQLGDLLAEGMQHLSSDDRKHLCITRQQLELLATARPCLNMNAFEIISQKSLAFKIVFFMGGFWQPRAMCLNRIYVIIFNVSFWLCGVLCMINIAYKAMPYHIAATDFLTAYVHLPAWQGWRMWRKYVMSHECNSLMGRILEREDFDGQIAFLCRVAGWLVLIVQVAMVCIVLVGFSLPNTLGYFPSKEVANAHMPGDYKLLESIHAGIMWFVIPPVIASMFASYSMFAFVSVLHFFDIEILKETLADCSKIVARFQRNMNLRNHSDDSSDTSTPSMGLNNPMKQMHEDLAVEARLRTLEKYLHDNVYEIISMLAFTTQRRIDETCSFCSWVWLHLVLFSTLQVLAICNGFRVHSSKIPEESTWDSYKWWFAFQDFFHLGGGIVLLTVAFGLPCIVRFSFDKVPEKAMELFTAAKASRLFLVNIQGCLKAREFGMHVLGGTVYIDTPKAFLFFVFLLIGILDHALSLLNEADVGRRAP